MGINFKSVNCGCFRLEAALFYGMIVIHFFLKHENIIKKFQNITIHKNIMYLCLMHSKELLKGTLQTIILKLLSDEKRMYGYEITQKVKEITAGELVLTEGALYPTLHKLEKQGLLITEKEIVSGRTRKYYSLTPSGVETSDLKRLEFQQFIRVMQLILQPKTNLNAQ